MTEEQADDIDKGVDSIYKAIHSDEMNFETKITYLNAGAITLTLTFLSFQKSGIDYILLLVAGMGLCIGSLVYNMILYLVAKEWHRNNIDVLLEAKKDGAYKCPDELIDAVCKRIDQNNWYTLILMIEGVLILILFVCLNL